MEWISVEDRLPEQRDIVLIIRTNKYAPVIELAFHVPGFFNEWTLMSDPMNFENDLKITHWMPLPDIPEDVKELYAADVNKSN
jgi:hypothetical protein